MIYNRNDMKMDHLDHQDIAILTDMSLSMTTFLMGRILSKDESDLFFESNKERLRLQGLPEDKINKLSIEMVNVVDKIREMYNHQLNPMQG